MDTRILSAEQLNTPHSHILFRRTRALALSYFGISVLTLVVAIVLRHHTTIVTPAVWIRGTIVAASALLTVLFASGMASGRRRAYLRLRMVSAIMLVAIVIIIAVPGVFPLWMKIEQGVCGLLLLGIVAAINGRYLRTVFSSK